MSEVTFGDVLKMHRNKKGLSQTEFGKKLGYTQSIISSYENDVNVPNLNTLASIASKLNVSVCVVCPFHYTRKCKK